MSNLENFQKLAYEAIIELDNTKIKILSGSMRQFILTFSKLHPVDFSEITVDENIFDNEIFNSEEFAFKIAIRAKKLNLVLIDLNNKFIHDIERLKNIIDFLGTDYKSYNDNAKNSVMVSARLATTIIGVLSSSLLNEGIDNL